MMRRAMKLFPKGLVVGSASLGLTYVYKNRINQEIKNRQPLAAYVSSQCEGGSNSTKKTDKKPREISIDTPWGKMAGKHWPRKTETSKTPENNSDKSSKSIDKNLPFLCFHGWLDNAGTFDRLIPLIQKTHPDAEFYVFDWPGHGQSDPRPSGTYVNSLALLYDIGRVVKQLGLEKTGFNGLGHSLGGNALTQYMCAYPDQVKSMICLDVLGFHIPEDRDAKSLRSSVTNALRLESKTSKPREYSYQSAKDRFLQGSGSIPHTVDAHAAEVMMKRALKVCEGKDEKDDCWVWTRDLKNTLPAFPAFTYEVATGIISDYNKTQTNCNYLHLMADDMAWYRLFSKLWTKLGIDETRWSQVKTLISEFSQNPNHKWQMVEGNHHFHLNNPECCVERINSWLADPEKVESTLSFEELKRAWQK